MKQNICKMVLGQAFVPAECADLVDVIRTHLAHDNNKLREDLVCSLLGYSPSWGGAGHPDGYKPDETPVDVKSGPIIKFPDGGNTIVKKLDWTCLVHEYTEKGDLIYICEVLVSDIIDELIESAEVLTKKKQRVSPMVSSTVWLNAPHTVCRYKNPEHFRTTSKTGKIIKLDKLIDQLPYHKED